MHGGIPSYDQKRNFSFFLKFSLAFFGGVNNGGDYAQTLIVVAFLVVNIFVFLVITRNPTMRFGPKLEEIFLSASRSFLYLSGTFLKAINVSFLTQKFLEKIKKNFVRLKFRPSHPPLECRIRIWYHKIFV